MNVDEKLKYWSSHCLVGHIVASNFPKERFLPLTSKSNLLAAIDSVTWNSPPVRANLEATASAYRNACHRHSREGGETPAHVATGLLGRAVEFNTFAQALTDAFPSFFYHVDDARDFLLRLSCGDALTSAEATLTMSKLPRSAWATWDEEDSTKDPFRFATDASDRVRACIGLDPRGRDRDGLLLLIFRRPLTLHLFRPTIADAALHLFFEPAPPPEDEHGWTRPWLPGSHGIPEDHLLPRPEVVHTPVEFSQLHNCRLTP